MNKFKPVLSICIPCYKRINQVRNTLNSIYEANSEISMDDYEVILSDNDPEMEVKTLMDEFSDKINLFYSYHLNPSQSSGQIIKTSSPRH